MGRLQVESRLFATFTVPTGEMHEDFKTLKEEIQRETQEVEKLSHVGQSSLLAALSKLLGKKKELQDLEVTVRSPWKCVGERGWEKGFRCRCSSGEGGLTLAEGDQGPGDVTADAFPKLARCPRLPWCLWRRTNSAVSSKAHAPS